MNERELKKRYKARPEMEYLGSMTDEEFRDSQMQERIELVDVRLRSEHSLMNIVRFKKKVLIYAQKNGLTPETKERKKRGFTNILPRGKSA